MMVCFGVLMVMDAGLSVMMGRAMFMMMGFHRQRFPVKPDAAHGSAAHTAHGNFSPACLAHIGTARTKGTALRHIFYIGLYSRQGMKAVLGQSPP